MRPLRIQLEETRNWLGPLVAELLPFDLVIEELRPQIVALV